jgi:hypothetical protein
MAHEFIIINTSDEKVTYTDYDSINLSTLKNVISFKPDLGTLVDSNEILFETDTFDSSSTDKFITEGSITTIEVELETGTGTGGLLLETGSDVTMQDSTFSEEKTFIAGDDLVLDGTDSSSTNSGDNLIIEFADGKHKLVPENWSTGSENHLLLETATDSVVDNHYHAPVSEEHEDGDGHTEAEHREISLWNYKLQVLMARERLNNAS